MSIRVLASVLSFSDAVMANRLALIAIADASSDDGVAWPSVKEIARKAKLGERTVARALKELEAAGELELVKAQKGRARINVYRVLVGRPHDVDYERLPFKVAFSQPAKSAGAQSRPAAESADGLPPTHARKEDPSVDPPLSSNDESARARPRDPVWDTLVEIFGTAPSGRSERGRWNRATADLRSEGATPEQVQAVARAYREHKSFKDCVLTPTALAANYRLLLAESRPKEDAAADRLRERMAKVLG